MISKRFLFPLCVALLWSCSGVHNNDNANSKAITQQQLTQLTGSSEEDIKMAQTTVNEFYTYYLENIYMTEQEYPDFINISPHKYIYDVSLYKSMLQTLPNVSENFVQDIVINIENCNKALMELNWEEAPEGEFSIDNPYCNSLSHNWGGGMETITTHFEVGDFHEVTKDTVTVDVKLLDENNYTDETLLRKLTLVKSNKNWLIDGINE